MRRRPGGIFRAFGALMLIFLVGPIVILALIAYFVYGVFRGRRGDNAAHQSGRDQSRYLNGSFTGR